MVEILYHKFMNRAHYFQYRFHPLKNNEEALTSVSNLTPI